MTLASTILIEGLNDLVDESHVYSFAMEHEALEPADLRALALGTIFEVLERGWMLAGSLDDDFQPWSGSAGQAFERIARTWLQKWEDEPPTPGAVVWLRNTAQGDAVARAFLSLDEVASSRLLRTSGSRG